MARAATAKAAPRRAAARTAAARTAPARPAPRTPARRAPARRTAPTRPARRPTLAERGRAIVRSRCAALLDRLFNGPALIGLVFVLLVGIVFANVALLQQGRQVTRDAARVSELKRENASLRREVAELGSSERIQAVAAERGLVLPAPGDVTYLRANPQIDARNAAKEIDEEAAAAEYAATTYVDPATTYSDPAATTYTDPAATTYTDPATTYVDPAAGAP